MTVFGLFLYLFVLLDFSIGYILLHSTFNTHLRVSNMGIFATKVNRSYPKSEIGAQKSQKTQFQSQYEFYELPPEHALRDSKISPLGANKKSFNFTAQTIPAPGPIACNQNCLRHFAPDVHS